jgi:hypothetical protein
MTGFRPTALLHVRGHTDTASDRSSITRLYSPRFCNSFFLSGLFPAKLRSRAREEASPFCGLLKTASRVYRRGSVREASLDPQEFELPA